MLEQPPERSSLEVEAEVAAAAQISPPRRLHGSFRILIWCMPTSFFYGFSFAFGYATKTVLPNSVEAAAIVIFFVLVIGLIFSLGYFEVYSFPNVIAAKSPRRQREMLLYAAKFTATQLLFIPALTLVLFIICIIIFDGVSF